MVNGRTMPASVIGTGFVVWIFLSASAVQANDTVSMVCKALERADFSTIEDAPAQVMDANVVEGADEMPAYCRVQGYIWPQIGFELRLPVSSWNGKFLQIGIGGHGGSLSFEALWCDHGLRRGYACILFDTGHKGNVTDALWAYNNVQAEVDYAIRSPHVTAIAGKAITRQFFGRKPEYSYFMGCSGGGRQALLEAQRFPHDFDGIISLDPSLRIVGGTEISWPWNVRALHDQDGQPLFTDEDLELLHEAALAECDDMDDNIKDGIIADPRHCKVDPAQLRCNTKERSACLSRQQIAAAKKVYGGPVTSSGEQLYYGALPGSEKQWTWPNDSRYPQDRIRYMALIPDPGPGWTISEEFFDSYHRRNGVMVALYAADNPDLRRFKAVGGKLIIAGHWSGGSPLAIESVDYYEMVEKVMGGRKATQEFVRLFMLPGHNHCNGGTGANSYNYIEDLEAWVEQHRAPDMMIGAHVDYSDMEDSRLHAVSSPKESDRITFTRPVYPYPSIARYKGSGDPDDYRNFEPVER